MNERDLIQLYLNDADVAIGNITKSLDAIDKGNLKIDSMDSTPSIKAQIEEKIGESAKECIQNIRNLTMICWMAGKDEKNPELDFLTQLDEIHDLFFTRILNYITKVTARGEIIVEFLKLFEITIRDNTYMLNRIMGKERNLTGKLQNLMNQNSHSEQDQMIRRWILKIIYIYQINQNKLESYTTLEYLQKRKDYLDDHPLKNKVIPQKK